MMALDLGSHAGDWKDPRQEERLDRLNKVLLDA